MAQSETIREYLVALGFKLDEGSLRKFSDAISKGTKAVVGLAAAIEATALGIAAGVSRFASNLESLYFAAQRTGTAATNLKAFDRAAQDFGAGAGEAQASIEGLAAALRENPGNEGVLNSLLTRVGKQARDSRGDIRDLSEVMLDLGKVFRGQPFYVAKQYASMLGIDDKTLLAMRDDKFEENFRKQQRVMKNSSFDKAAKDAHQFMMQMRDLGTVLQQFGLRVYDALVRKLEFSIEKLAQWFRVNGPMIADRVADILVQILKLADNITPAIGYLVDKFLELDRSTGGWSTKLIAVLAALKFFGGISLAGIVTGVARLGIALAAIMPELAALGAAAASLYMISNFKPKDTEGDKLAYEKGGIYQFTTRMKMRMGDEDAQKFVAENDPVEYFKWRSFTEGPARGMAAEFADEGVPSTPEYLDKFINALNSGGKFEDAGKAIRKAASATEAYDIYEKNIGTFFTPAEVSNAQKQTNEKQAAALQQEVNITVNGAGQPDETARAIGAEMTRILEETTRQYAGAVK